LQPWFIQPWVSFSSVHSALVRSSCRRFVPRAIGGFRSQPPHPNKRARPICQKKKKTGGGGRKPRLLSHPHQPAPTACGREGVLSATGHGSTTNHPTAVPLASQFREPGARPHLRCLTSVIRQPGAGNAGSTTRPALPTSLQHRIFPAIWARLQMGTQPGLLRVATDFAHRDEFLCPVMCAWRQGLRPCNGFIPCLGPRSKSRFHGAGVPRSPRPISSRDIRPGTQHDGRAALAGMPASAGIDAFGLLDCATRSQAGGRVSPVFFFELRPRFGVHEPIQANGSPTQTFYGQISCPRPSARANCRRPRIGACFPAHEAFSVKRVRGQIAPGKIFLRGDQINKHRVLRRSDRSASRIMPA